jgi:hypothetical protein
VSTARILFAPGQSQHSMWLVVSETRARMLEALKLFNGEVPDPDTQAAVCFDHGRGDGDCGLIHFNREDLSRKVIAHECSHAALHWVNEYVMTSPEVVAMSEAQQAEYFDECLATVVEALFEQIDAALFPEANERTEP